MEPITWGTTASEDMVGVELLLLPEIEILLSILLPLAWRMNTRLKVTTQSYSLYNQDGNLFKRPRHEKHFWALENINIPVATVK